MLHATPAVQACKDTKNAMLTRINAAKCIGIDAVGVTVETDMERGIGIHLVGLADTAVKESLLRILTALDSLGYRVPGKKIVINLAPADLRKRGSGYDLPIAAGIITSCSGQAFPCLENYLLMGELALDGSLRPVPGALIYAEYAAGKGMEGIVLPYGSALEACEIQGVRVYGARGLTDVLKILSGDEEACRSCLVSPRKESWRCSGAGRPTDVGRGIPDFADIIGQRGAKRALELACAGGHNMIMIGPPGSGKSSLAKAAAGILPHMDNREALRVSKIYSLCGGAGSGCSGLIRQRPFRAPHCTASVSAIIGGGGYDGIVPGEVTLADCGILFLDEFAQMPRSVIEALRAPLEDRKVTISRLRGKVEFPASFMLIAASNPCPCGYYGEGDRCVCTPYQRDAYISRLSGPIMDRIDIQVRVKSVGLSVLRGGAVTESSRDVAARVEAARDFQRVRFNGEGISTNAEMDNRQVARFCPLSADCRKALESVLGRSGMSMRAYFRLIKLARTIADVESYGLGSPSGLEPRHILEAASYRFLDKKRTITENADFFQKDLD